MSSQVTLVGNATRERRYTNGCATSVSMSRVNVVVPATQARPGTCPNLLRRSEMGNRTPRSTQHTDLSAQLAQRITSFWMQVDIGAPDECWPWTGYIEKDYGRFYFGDRMAFAHELALTFSTGERRHPLLETCHSCDNPPCCNPAHLRFDTRQGNVDDAIERDRHARGERNGHAKLTEADVVLMRERHALGATGRSLARDFGVTEGLVNSIVRGLRWKRAGGPIRDIHGNTKHGRYAK